MYTQQEDAHEFLRQLLAKLHYEYLERLTHLRQVTKTFRIVYHMLIDCLQSSISSWLHDFPLSVICVDMAQT